MIGIALIVIGSMLVGFFVFETFYLSIMWWKAIFHQKHQFYVLLFGIGFVIVGIKIQRKKKIV